MIHIKSRVPRKPPDRTVCGLHNTDWPEPGLEMIAFEEADCRPIYRGVTERGRVVTADVRCPDCWEIWRTCQSSCVLTGRPRFLLDDQPIDLPWVWEISGHSNGTLNSKRGSSWLDLFFYSPEGPKAVPLDPFPGRLLFPTSTGIVATNLVKGIALAPVIQLWPVRFRAVAPDEMLQLILYPHSPTWDVALPLEEFNPTNGIRHAYTNLEERNRQPNQPS